MTSSLQTNAMGQPIDPIVEGWTPRPLPPRSPIEGQHVRLEPYDIEKHARALYDAYSADPTGSTWTYMYVGPFETFEDYLEMARTRMIEDDPLFHTIIDKTSNLPLGVASFMRIAPDHGCIEVGNISYSPALQRTPGSTEAMYLMACRVFDELGYRRYEWKCNAMNAPSRRTALRLGFSFEGVFRKHLVVKGRNRDTAWYAMTDEDWPQIKANFETWLSPDNFDADGKQIQSLSTLNGQGA